MQLRSHFILIVSIAAGLSACAPNPMQCASIPGWSRLAPLPDAEGFASSYAGISQGALIVAGGANFPGKKPWAGGTKAWTDRIFVLPSPESAWIEPTRLTTALAYGVSASTREGVLCVGGGTKDAHVRDTFMLRWDGQRVTQTTLPSLPRPCAFAAGAVVGSVFYLVGGIETPNAIQALATFWALDLSKINQGWHELPPLPGPARMLSVAGTFDGVFYVFGGVSPVAGPDGKAQRNSLLDAYAYKPGHGWKRIADLPRAATAAPSPAPVTAKGELLVISGDDGLRAHLTGPDHPGFPTTVLVYDTKRDAWRCTAQVPVSRATAPTAEWLGSAIIVSGESKPGCRSNEIWRISPDQVAAP